MTIDAPRQHHIPRLQEIWQLAFGDSGEFVARFFETGFSPTRCRCVLEADTPQSVLYWFDCLRGQDRFAYVYAVATHPDCTGKGLSHALLADTHRFLKAQGYAGCILVPGSESLFRFYENQGYTPFCPMDISCVKAGKHPLPLPRLTGDDYAEKLQCFLPENTAAHRAPTFSYLAACWELYGNGDTLLALSRQEDTLYIQDFRGNGQNLPGIIAALGGKEAWVRTPGGKPYGMYHMLADQAPPAHFALPLD